MNAPAQPRVLLVDESKTFQQIFSSLLEEDACELLIVDNGTNALEMLKATPVDFVCTTLSLRDMDGIELACNLRRLQSFGSKPIVLLTSGPVQNLASKALPAGITEIFHKNDIEELITFIKRFVFKNRHIDARVLYVEDGDSQRLWLSSLLQQRGVTMDAHASTDTAWQDFLDKEYDLIITDIVLKDDQSGLGFINKIRRYVGTKGDVPILAVTAFDDLARRIELFTLGVNDYIVKPVITEELVARVNNLVRHKRP